MKVLIRLHFRSTSCEPTPLRTGVALAATVSAGYTACSLVFWIWPEAAAGFMNALFHGLDFGRLQSGSSLFSFGSFFYALVISAVWAFLLGALFGWLWTWLGGAHQPGPRPGTGAHALE